MAIEVGIDTELLKYEIKKTYARVAPRLPAKPLKVRRVAPTTPLSGCKSRVRKQRDRSVARAEPQAALGFVFGAVRVAMGLPPSSERTLSHGNPRRYYNPATHPQCVGWPPGPR
jgi:hypothetical protein